MSTLFPEPAYLPCPECGVPVPDEEGDEHVCDPECLLDYAVLQLREEIEGFDEEMTNYLDTPCGQFEAWDAERRRQTPD